MKTFIGSQAEKLLIENARLRAERAQEMLDKALEVEDAESLASHLNAQETGCQKGAGTSAAG